MKQSIDRYRTFNGERYIAWLYNFTENRVRAYRAADVKCRIVDKELFIRLLDEDQAKAVDRAIETSPQPPPRQDTHRGESE